MTPLKATRPREGRTAASPWALGGLSVRGLATRVYLRSWHDEILDRAAELSYYFAFALLPTLLFLTSLLGLLPVPDLMAQLIGYVERVLPGDAASLIKKTLAEAVRGTSGSLVSVSALVALVGASSGMLSIMKGLNAAYGITDRRTWLVLTGVTLVYYLAPAMDRIWSWVTPGSAFAVVSWLLMSLGLRFYVGYFDYYNATYGSIGGLILLMLWLYWSGVALLVGAEIDSAIEQAGAEHATESESGAAPMATLPRDA